MMQHNSNTTDDQVLEIRNLVIETDSPRKPWSEKTSQLVKDVSLNLCRGEVLGIIGESGAGKSTIGLASMGYARDGCTIAGGEVIFNGTDLLALSERDKRAYRGRHIAYVAQSAAASFNPAHKLIDQYVEAAVYHGVCSGAKAREEAVALYREMGLPEPETFGQRYPHQVSGGQLQRAMVATAMACRPDILVFDEPTTALDVTTQIEVLAAIRATIRTHNTAALYITHDLAVVAQMANRIMVLRHGELVEQGGARALLEAPTQAYTQQLVTVRQRHNDQKAIRDATPVLSMSGLEAAYKRGTPVLKDVSVQVAPGRTVAIVGESGSGKSTLARVVTGLLPPTEGTVELHGTSLSPRLKHRDKDTLRRLQMIYQLPDTALNPRQKVAEIIGRPLQFYLGYQGTARQQRGRELLAMVHLDASFMDSFPWQLSGGQKQRVCIARALAANPDIIICDEVTSALDQIVGEQILDLLMELQRELDMSYLFITHDLATVDAIADDVVVMQRGHVVEQGAKHEVFTPPHADYTQRLLNSAPAMDTRWLDRVLAAG